MLPASAFAHKLNVFAQARGETLVGRAYFTGDIPARAADVIARDAAGKELGRTKTDDEGNFTLPARVRMDYYLTAETADHASSPFVVSAAELPKSLSAASAPASERRELSIAAPQPVASTGGAAADLAGIEALQRQIEAMRIQLDQSETRLRFRDLIGGVGYILGLAGVWMYAKTRQRSTARQ